VWSIPLPHTSRTLTRLGWVQRGDQPMTRVSGLICALVLLATPSTAATDSQPDATIQAFTQRVNSYLELRQRVAKSVPPLELSADGRAAPGSARRVPARRSRTTEGERTVRLVTCRRDARLHHRCPAAVARRAPVPFRGRRPGAARLRCGAHRRRPAARAAYRVIGAESPPAFRPLATAGRASLP